MTRSRIIPIRQPDEDSCGPVSLKMALALLGRRASVARLRDLCQTNKNGTTTNNMIRAIRRLGLPSLIVEKTTLTHLLSALKTRPQSRRAIIVSYLYALDELNQPKPDSGHWAVVSSFRRSSGRIVLLDSYTGQKISYPWTEFRRRWIDETLKRRKNGKRGSRFTLIHKPERQLMIVVSTTNRGLPRFGIPTARMVN